MAGIVFGDFSQGGVGGEVYDCECLVLVQGIGLHHLRQGVLDFQLVGREPFFFVPIVFGSCCFQDPCFVCVLRRRGNLCRLLSGCLKSSWHIFLG